MTAPSHRSGDERADRRADYAEAAAKDGDWEAAIDLMRQALEVAPGWRLARFRLASFLESGGNEGEAIALYEAIRAEDAEDPYGAGLRLAALGAADTPPAPPPAFVAGLFDQYADRFETQLREKLAYRAPEELLAAIDAVAGGETRFADVLDLGCGTGLMGDLLHSRADRLVGLDLSPKMLAKARGKRIYDELYEADLLAFEASAPFSLIVAADVLNYLGDLAPVFARMRGALKTGGLFAFTIEAHEGAEPYVLGETMRYAHSGRAVAALLTEAGFAILAEVDTVLREDRGAPVRGRILVAGRRVAPLDVAMEPSRA